jgi:hypothetical protein
MKILVDNQHLRKESIVLEDYSPHKSIFKKQNNIENKNYDL